ncbi:MAG TPA: PVC-type heme-binding CxxCH protein [Planctomycetota bacterium]|nr:PVC-type heme-binding CxxCH protein [Planctomycetota bacterium]
MEVNVLSSLTRATVCFALLLASVSAVAGDAPLRVFIRAGVKTHGPGQHDHPRFLLEWKKLLNDRGAQCEGAMDFPTAEQLEKTDVLIMYCANGGNLSAEEKANLEKFNKRGGGMVVIHDAVCGNEADYFKTVIGGAWQHGKAKWYEGEVGIYFQDRSHPITKGVFNFDVEDEIYYSLNFVPEAKVLATSFHDVFTIAPQLWVYEKDSYRAVGAIPGHNYTTFSNPTYRVVLLRSIAWAGKRDNADMLCTPEELKAIEYPVGGPTHPSKSAEKLILHPDFNINLVAAEPLINKAMNIDWDEKGRLWVCETPEYPAGRKPPLTLNLEKGQKAQVITEERDPLDRISILEDTNGDGLMDKKTVFADKLELVTSFVLYKKGVIAAQAPDIYLLQDEDGDGKAEIKKTLYTGLGTGDTHAVINNLRWGYDGWIYATHGYSGGRVKAPDGGKEFGNMGSGVVRFKPDGSAFEQYCSKGGNTWGLDIAWDGEVFFTQPTSGDLLNHVVLPEYVLARGKVGKTPSFEPLIRNRPSLPYMTYKRQAYVQIDQVGRFTASAGCAIYNGGAWPDEWNYNYFTTEPQINVVHHEVVKPKGVTFSSDKNREPEFITSKDYWFRPIETRIGPDGALWIIDFYNQAVTHNDTRGPNHTFRNAAVRPDRDHYFGRIYRVQHKQAKTLPPANLGDAAGLLATLEHPNQHTRMNAVRLLIDKGDGAPVAELQKIVMDEKKPAPARVGAVWVLANLKKHTTESLTAALKSADAAVRKNAARAASIAGVDVTPALTALVKDSDARIVLEAIVTLSNTSLDKNVAAALLEVYSTLDNPWAKSAVFALTQKNPGLFAEGAFAGNDPALAENLAMQAATGDDAAGRAQLLLTAVAQPADKNALKAAVLRALSSSTKPVQWSDALQEALKKLLNSDDQALAAVAIPLVARWDTKGALAADLKAAIGKAQGALNDEKLTDDQRADLVRSMLTVASGEAAVLNAAGTVLAGKGSTALKKQIVLALSDTASKDACAQILGAFGKLPGDVQMIALDECVKRTEWSLALLEALSAGSVKPTLLGPANLQRLRLHPEAAVAKRANEVIDQLMGPEVKEKNELIAKLTPEVVKAGDAEKGKEVFNKSCAVCHKFGDLGREVGPVLNGMGAHGPAELLVSILDPNRAVEPNYTNWLIRTKSGETLDGIIARENANSILLKNAGGEREVKISDIASRRNTGMSLMPNGLEALGTEALRDLLTYICSKDQKYRFVDLSTAYTADVRKGLYLSETNLEDTVNYIKFGSVVADGIPYNIPDASKMPGGKNIIVLKGGGGSSKSMPQKVEAKLGYAVRQFHFLSGIAGWGYPAVKEKVPVLKVTVHFAGGATEEKVLQNGVEFADYIAEVDVPGSKLVKGVVKNKQMRYFAVPVSRPEVIEKITLESYGNAVAPTIGAITAELVSDEKK